MDEAAQLKIGICIKVRYLWKKKLISTYIILVCKVSYVSGQYQIKETIQQQISVPTKFCQK